MQGHRIASLTAIVCAAAAVLLIGRSSPAQSPIESLPGDSAPVRAPSPKQQATLLSITAAPRSSFETVRLGALDLTAILQEDRARAGQPGHPKRIGDNRSQRQLRLIPGHSAD